LDVPTFRRAICYAMGDQWTRLAMTSAEFDALVKKHMRLDQGHQVEALFDMLWQHYCELGVLSLL
jgi:hypothetical protein